MKKEDIDLLLKDFCSCFGENYIIENICESLGCSEDDIEIEEIYNDEEE